MPNLQARRQINRFGAAKTAERHSKAGTRGKMGLSAGGQFDNGSGCHLGAQPNPNAHFAVVVPAEAVASPIARECAPVAVI